MDVEKITTRLGDIDEVQVWLSSNSLFCSLDVENLIYLALIKSFWSWDWFNRSAGYEVDNLTEHWIVE